jgi:hypothetical protein
VLRPQRRSDARDTLNENFRALMKEICVAVPEFSRFDLSRVAVSVGTSRSQTKHGIWAYVTPLRYVGGGLYRKGLRRGVPGQYTYVLGDVDLEAPDAPLYLITILVPRFFSLSFDERIETLVHELYHLHPEFRGDLRRFAKPHVHHGPTPAAYNRRVKELVDEALARNPFLAEHPLLRDSGADFLTKKKQRLARPRLRFVPKLFGVLLALSMLSPAPTRADETQTHDRTWRWPWEDKNIAKAGGPLDDEMNDFDAKNSARGQNPRFIVTPKEEMNLKTSPSEWAADMLAVKPGQNFLAAGVDSSGEWIFLRTRKLQGWVRADKLDLVGQLAVPELSGGVNFETPKAADLTPNNVTTNTRVDGDPVFIPGEGEISEDDLLSFNRDLDSVVATSGGPLYEQPDPLSVRYGSVQSGDKVLILKRGEKGDWAYVRLVLTGEEGWFPSEWLRITRGIRVSGSGKGRIALDLDGGYGSAGRNIGFGLGVFSDLKGASVQSSASRFEVGGFFQSFVGEDLSYASQLDSRVYSLDTRYSIFGGGARLVGFTPGGFLGGALEAAATYQLVQSSLAGLSESVVAESGLRESLRSRMGLMVGVRGLMSITSWMQLNTLARFNLASGSNLFWAGAGLSFRIF